MEIQMDKRSILAALNETQNLLARQEAYLPLPAWSSLEKDRQQKIAFYKAHIAKLSALLDA